MATNNVEDYRHSTHLLAATTLRNVLGTKCLAQVIIRIIIKSIKTLIALSDLNNLAVSHYLCFISMSSKELLTQKRLSLRFFLRESRYQIICRS